MQLNSPTCGCSRIQGVSEAIVHYGQPIERTTALAVDDELFTYWRLVLSNRDAEVVLAAQRPDGHFLVHTKGEYPEGVYRIMSGGINRGEDILHAVHRELGEETGLDGRVARFVGALTTRFQHDDQELEFFSYVFHVIVTDGVPAPMDDSEDILGFREISLHEMSALADDLESLAEGFWRDWGRFRAIAHRLIVEELSS